MCMLLKPYLMRISLDLRLADITMAHHMPFAHIDQPERFATFAFVIVPVFIDT